jgi:ATP adenylyltransferase
MERFKALHSPSEDLAGLFEGIGNAQDDEKHLVVWRGVSVFVLMNLFPYNNGHMMIAPYRRVASYMELTTEERHELADVLAKCQQWLDEVLRPEGYNIGMNLGKAAGAGIPGHLHVHVVPRWSGDTNFMPTVADIKVVPQAIEETYSKLRAVADRDHDQ